ncbi:hypothetical protein ACDW_04020 [Acidovorax sp. DW039]|uniref:hypothetical protein n=1 Tax=Acidovorax sp. DW039 TaxID=3095606 RepID=UPI0030918F53|nr:hypothetical protein ACDW_04020 [Acidovorax sp. DW039]
MSKSLFDELHAKATNWYRDFEQHKEECRIFAERLRIEYIEYLGAKSTDIEFHVLDESLERLKNEGTTLSPRIQMGDDGYIYFGLTIFFKFDKGCVDEHIRVGVQRTKGQWRVRWNTLELAFNTSIASHEAFFQKATASIAEKFSTPFHKQRAPLGFVPVISSNDHLTLVPPPLPEIRIAAEAPNGKNEESQYTGS